MQCGRCGRPAADDDRFCGGCGTPLARACPSCGREMAPDAAFCTRCGEPVGPRASARTPAEDRRPVSVLFVDVVDFTPYAESSDPEQVRTTQSAFFAATRQVIGQYGGVVEKYIGDAVMAIFGAPVATETDAVRCVRAGLELQRVLGAYAADGLRCRVGVATGEALVDVDAARDGGQAILAGDVVNTASRLQSVAPPGGVLVCAATYEASKASIRYAEQPPVTLRGRSRPTEVWLALAPMQRNHPGREMDPTPLVNRTHEIDLLVGAMHRALDEHTPQLVTVLGHAGIGKSRLVRELYGRRAADGTVAWRTGRCPPFGENVTYAAFADIVKAQAGILDSDAAGPAQRRLTEAMRDLVPPAEANRLVAALGPLIGLPGTALAPEEIESSWRRFVVALATARPTVLVFEDLHWADEPMLRLVELLGATVRDVPLLLLATARPELVERNPGWAAAIPGSLAVTLPPLRDAEIATMYTHLFGPAAFPPATLEPLVELADGNPLYAHEYTRMLIEQGRLRPLDGPLPMPDSVHAVIANRVDLLDPVDRATLQAAAVVGMRFWPGAVAAALGRPVDAVERSLRRLEQRDLIHEQVASAMEGQPEYRFGHVLVREICYQRLPRTERMGRHERTADWLDQVSTGRATDLAEVLAHHRVAAHEIALALGVDPGRFAAAARDALHRAARRAYTLNALDVAAAHAERARSLCDADTPTVQRLQLDLLATEIAFYAGEVRDASRLTALAEELYAAGGQAGAARAWTLLGQAAWLRADRAAALSGLDRAVELFEELPDSLEKAEAYAELGRLHMLNLESEPALAAAGAAADIGARLGLAEVTANARITIGTARYQAGDRAGLAELQDITELCRTGGLLAGRRAVQNLSYALREEGDWPGSAAVLDQAAHHLATGYSSEAQRAYFDGDWPKLLGCAKELLATPNGEWDLHVRGLCGWVGWLSGHPEDDVESVLAAGRRSGFHRLLWTGLAHSALTRALQGRPDEAKALLAELVDDWRRVRSIASGEWLAAAAHAAALSGSLAAVRELLGSVPHRTPWVEAATRTVTGAARGAADLHLAAAAIYADIPVVTERMMALTLAVRAAPDLPVAGELAAFAARNNAPRLVP